MADQDSTEAGLRQRFVDVMSGKELADLRRIFGLVKIYGLDAHMDWGPLRPELRRPPLEGLHAYRLLVDFPGSEPRIWRLLEIRSDTRLEVLHHYIQLLFGWQEERTHRFALGAGGPFSHHSQLFLSEEEDPISTGLNTSSVGEAFVRLDEVLQHPMDMLHYAYNVADEKALLGIMLVDTRPVPGLEPVAVLDGAGDAPPLSYSGPLDDEDAPRHGWRPFDAHHANSALQGDCSAYAGVGVGIHQRLADLHIVMGETPEGQDCRRRIRLLLADDRVVGHQELLRSLMPVQWFLEKAAVEGLGLTEAGYLRPADVQQAATVVPRQLDRSGGIRREAHAPEIRRFRDSLTEVGLLEQDGRRMLQTSTRGDRLRTDPWALWSYLGGVLLPDDGFSQDAALLLLLHAATSTDGIQLEQVADALTTAGWGSGGKAIHPDDFAHLPLLGILGNLTHDPWAGSGPEFHISRAASILARSALLRWG